MRVVSLPTFELELLSLVSDRLESTFDTRADYVTYLQQVRERLYKQSWGSPRRLQELAAGCRRCSSATDGSAVEPIWNVTNPDLLIMLEHPNVLKSQDTQDLLKRGLLTSGFSPSQVGLSYLNRCVPSDGSYNIDEIMLCAPYRESEIDRMNPKLIMMCGSGCASAYGYADIKIRQHIESEWQVWIGAWPVMFNYSPAIALANSDINVELFLRQLQKCSDILGINGG